MNRFFIILGLILITPLMVLSLLSVGLGHAIGEQPADFGKVENCRLPCWNGIRPGRTPIKDADTTLREAGYVLQDEGDSERLSATFSYKAALPSAAVCQVGVERSQGLVPTVAELTLRFCDGAFLGHIVDMLGEPDSILPIVSLMNYQQGQVVVILRSPMCTTIPSPHTPLLFISLSSQVISTQQNSILAAEQAGEKDSTSTNLPWRGFIPIWRYQELFPGRAVC
jgi:hypothetical protein